MPHTHMQASVRARHLRRSASRLTSSRAIRAGDDVDIDNAVTPARAWALILPAFLCFSLLDSSGKWLVTAGFAPLFVVWCRFAAHLVYITVFLRSWEHMDRLRTRHPVKQAVRGGLLVTSTIGNFMALQTMQLAETMAIYLAAPMVLTALAGPLLGEWAGPRRWAAVGIGFVGVLIVVRPGTDAFQWAALWAILSLMSATLYFLMTRALTATETDESMIVYSGLVPAILLLPALFIWGEWPSASLDLVLLLAMGLFGSVGHLFVIKAHRLAPAPMLAPAVFSQIIWMVALGWLIFGDVPDGWTGVGCAVIISSGLYILARERRLANEGDRSSTEPDVARMRD